MWTPGRIATTAVEANGDLNKEWSSLQGFPVAVPPTDDGPAGWGHPHPHGRAPLRGDGRGHP